MTLIRPPLAGTGNGTLPLGAWRFFPGWLMLGFSAGAQFLSAPGQSYSVAAFKEPMRDGLAITETEYSMAYGVATLISGLSLPWTGRLLDRVGARPMLPIVASLLGVSCVAMSHVTSVMGVFLCFALLRCLGQGAMTLIGTWLIGEWFLRRRGFATALAGVGSSLSVMVFPVLNGYIIQNYGWRVGWQVLGIVVVAIIVVPSAVWLRSRPEDMQLLPDGDPPPSDVHGAEPMHASTTSRPWIEDSWTLREVLRDATFWKLLSVPMCTGMIGTGMVFHQVSVLGNRGVSATWALSLISLQAVVAAVFALGAGWLTDLWRSERLLAMAMVFLGSSVGIVLVMPRPSFAIAYAVLMGLHTSILQSAGTVVWVNYYGRKHQGTIRGVAFSMMILAAAIGPLPIALARDAGYHDSSALIVFAVLPIAAAILVATADRPVRKATD